MRIEKKGRVEVIKLERKRGPIKKPKRRVKKLSWWRRWWARVKLRLAECPSYRRPTTVTATQLVDRIIREFGSDYRYHLLISDSVYYCLRKHTAKRFLKKNKVDLLNYVSEFGDCDDFADALVGSLTKDYWPFGFAFGELWYYTKSYGHAINWFFDGSEVWLIEPQTDRIYKWEDILKYEDSKAKAFMVKV